MANSKFQKLVSQYSEESMDRDQRPRLLSGGYEDTIFLSTPPESLSCPVCLLVLKEPHLLSCCGEHICEVCITNIKKQSNVCPCCRSDDYTTLLNKRMRGNVHSLKVNCINKYQQCPWTGELRDLERHLDEMCEYTSVECEYGCGHLVPRHALYEHHLQDCSKCPVEVRIEGISSRLENQLSKLETKYDEAITDIRDTINEQKRLMQSLQEAHSRETNGLKADISRLSNEIELIKKGLMSTTTNATVIEKPTPPKATTVTTTPPAITNTIPTDYPPWYTPTTQSGDCLVPPCILIMDNFTVHKRDADVWYSQPFYSTCENGYKFCLSLHANGDNTGKGSHISLYVILMKGPCDESLKWPFKGDFQLQLLNWKEDKTHISATIKFDEYTPKEWSRRLYDVERAVNGRGKHRFLVHSQLGYRADKNTEYQNNDRLCFRVLKINCQ